MVFSFFFVSLCFRATGEADVRHIIALTGFTSQSSGGSCSPCMRTICSRRSRRFFSAKHAPNSLPHTHLGESIRAVGTIDADLSVRPGSYRASSARVSPTIFPCFAEAVSDPADLDPASTGGCHGSASPHRSTVRPELPGCLKPASSCRW